jgi:hypothetical protein
MAKCVITFLFDGGQVFQESWELADGHRDPLPARLRRFAHARLPLLASCVRIVQLKAKGHSLERVSWRGTGGTFAHARDALKLMDGGRSTSIFLRGVPREVFASRGLTPQGFGSFREFNRTASECGCVIVRGGEVRPITKLEPSHYTLFSYKKGKRATLRKLVSILGDEEAHRFWDDLKNKLSQQGNRSPMGESLVIRLSEQASG